MLQKFRKTKLETLNPNLLKAEYGVRGEILKKANEISKSIKNGNKKLPFNEIIYCNIGNPPALNQKPISFVRNVLSLVNSPKLLKSEHVSKIFFKDEIERANEIIKSSPGVFGGYTSGIGFEYVRKHVCEFIQNRDQCNEIPVDRVHLTAGAGDAIHMIVFSLIRNKMDGIMIPIPQYPLYTCTISLYGGTEVPYYLNEDDEWSISKEELERSYLEGKRKGINVRALVLINPGNPTGQVFSKKNLVDVVKFCFKHSIILLADEVYQENVYDEKSKWYSVNRIVFELGKEYFSNFECISFHSTSKGFFGECGRRGGYMHLSNGFNQKIVNEISKRCSMNSCSNIGGQIAVDIMVKPPKNGDESYKLFIKEKNSIIESLKRRSITLCKSLNSLKGIKCNFSAGAMYAFPQIYLPQKAIDEAMERKLFPDTFYCLEVLKKTGICLVSGSSFRQKKGTFHFRTTILPQEDIFESVIEKLKDFHKNFLKVYS